MNILLINHYAGSYRHGMEYRPYYLAREWTKMGHRVTVAAASYSHLRTRQPSTGGAVTVEEIDGIQYIWLKTPSYRGNGGGRVANMISFISHLWIRAAGLAALKPDAVIASSTYPLDIYPALKISRNAGAVLIYEVHDLWPLTLVELGGMPRSHPLIAWMQQAENLAYRKADRIVSMLPAAAGYMQDHGMAPQKFNYIPGGIIPEEWINQSEKLPEQHSRFFDKIQSESRFALGYTGSHGISNALDVLVDAAALLRAYPVEVIIVGQGPEKESLIKKAEAAGLENITFLQPVPKSCVPALLSRMDAVYLGYKQNSLYRFGVNPNKLFDYMIAAKPVIYAVEAPNDPVAVSGCGLPVSPGDSAAVADAVIKLMGASADERHSMGERGREYVLAHHEYRKLAGRFLDLMSAG